MKALTLSETKKFEIIEKEQPTINEKQVLIKVSKTGICGSDIHMIWATGYNAGTNSIIGHEFCGEIAAVNPNSSFKIGDRVVAMEIDSCLNCNYCNNGQENICDHVLDSGPGVGADGGYAEYVAVREDMVRHLPDNVSDISGATIEPAAIALHGLNMAQVNENSNILITGCGAIGMFAAACAHAIGVKNITITEANPERVKMAAESGIVTHALNATSDDLEEKLKTIAPAGFDSVIECSGNKIASTTGLNHLRKGGHMSLIAYGEQPEINIFNFVNSEFHLSGSLFFTRHEFETVIDLMSQNKLNLEPFTKIIPMEQVQTTLLNLEKGSENSIKYIIDINAEYQNK